MERASGVRARALMERNKALGCMAASLTRSPISMALSLAHMTALLSVGVGAFVTQNFPEI
jgi:hypothetical protein